MQVYVDQEVQCLRQARNAVGTEHANNAGCAFSASAGKASAPPVSVWQLPDSTMQLRSCSGLQ